jgi:thioesterase domain-containing protein
MAARRPTSTFWWSADGYLAAVWIGTWRQSFRYRPLAVPALLLETEWSRRRRRDHMLGWSHVLKGPVEVLAVGGDHWSLLDDVHGPALVAALSAQLGVADVAAS